MWCRTARPKEPAAITEVSGVVRHAGTVKGQQKLVVESEDGQKREILVPRGAHVMAQEGERVEAGDSLTEGDPSPHDILAVKGEKELQRYMTDKIQEVYRSQGVGINDKHIEAIVRQMLRRVRVKDVGDTNFLVGEQVEEHVFEAEDEARGPVQVSFGNDAPAAPPAAAPPAAPPVTPPAPRAP